jgi:hypothetical protein
MSALPLPVKRRQRSPVHRCGRAVNPLGQRHAMAARPASVAGGLAATIDSLSNGGIRCGTAAGPDDV